MNFEQIIREKLAAGASIEDIIGEMGSTLATVTTEKKGVPNEREELLDRLDKSFWADVEKEELGVSDAVALAVLVFANTKYTDWDVDDIKEFWDLTMHSLHTTAKMIGKSPLEALQLTLEDIEKNTNKRGWKSTTSCDCGKPAEPVGKATAHVCVKPAHPHEVPAATDKEKIAEFFKKLGI